MNIGESLWPDPVGAARRVRQMQRKLHHWAVGDPGRRFDDVFNLVYHPDFLTVAWERVAGNKGARTAGVDRVSPASIAEGAEVVEFLEQVRDQLKSAAFAPLPVRERLIPKPGSSKLRRLGIPTAMGRVRLRVADKRVLALIKAFLTAGVMSADGKVRNSDTGTPQGGIVSPLLANIALSVLDQHFCAKWDAHATSWRREAHRKRGGATYRIVRYADDFVIMVAGTKAHADGLWDEVAEVIAPLGLRLSVEKTRVCHLDQGFDFLGFHIQRRRRKGTNKNSVY